MPACSTLMMLLGACAVKLASSHIQAISLPRLTLDRASATIASVGAVAVLVFVGHRQLQAAKAQVFFEDSIKQSRMIEKLSRQSTGQAALYAAKTKMKTAAHPMRTPLSTRSSQNLKPGLILLRKPLRFSQTIRRHGLIWRSANWNILA